MSAGGVTAVAAAMRMHRSEEPVQRWALRALGNLAADHPTNSAIIAAAGGAGLAYVAEQAHPEARYVGEYARTLVQLLAIDTSRFADVP